MYYVCCPNSDRHPDNVSLYKYCVQYFNRRAIGEQGLRQLGRMRRWNCALILVLGSLHCYLVNAGVSTRRHHHKTKHGDCDFKRFNDTYFYGPIIHVFNHDDIDECVRGCWKYEANGVRQCFAVNFMHPQGKCELMHQAFDPYDRMLAKYYGSHDPNAIYMIPTSCTDGSTPPGTPAKGAPGGKKPGGNRNRDDASAGRSNSDKLAKRTQEQCGETLVDPMAPKKRAAKNRIVGGATADENSIPWIVSIRFGYTEPRQHACGGTLIRVSKKNESDIIITAAHCVQDEFETDYVEIVAGGLFSTRANAGEQRSGYKEAVFHENFNASTKEYDIAVVKLTTPFKFGPNVQPACLPPPGEIVKDGTDGLVAGWGKLAEDGEVAAKLQKVVVPVVNSDKCKELLKNDKLKFTDEKIEFCAGDVEGGKDSCRGDSGGPIFFKNGKGSYVLQGIVSFGTGCARKDKAGVYARVSAFNTWINDNVKKMSTLLDN